MKYKVVGTLDLRLYDNFLPDGVKTSMGVFVPQEAIEGVKVIKGTPYIILKEEWRNNVHERNNG